MSGEGRGELVADRDLRGGLHGERPPCHRRRAEVLRLAGSVCGGRRLISCRDSFPQGRVQSGHALEMVSQPGLRQRSESSRWRAPRGQSSETAADAPPRADPLHGEWLGGGGVTCGGLGGGLCWRVAITSHSLERNYFTPLLASACPSIPPPCCTYLSSASLLGPGLARPGTPPPPPLSSEIIPRLTLSVRPAAASWAPACGPTSPRGPSCTPHHPPWLRSHAVA